MSNYWNWYFECPYCLTEVDCHVQGHVDSGRRWLEAELPDECPLCDSGLVEDWPKLEEETIEHYQERHYDPPEFEIWELEHK